MQTITDVGSKLYPVPVVTPLTIVAGDTQDGTEQTGLGVDRESAEFAQFNGPPLSAMLVIGLSGANVATGETVTIVANLEHDTVSNFATTADFAPPVSPVGDHPAVTVARTLAGPVTGARVVLTHSYDLSGAKRYVRPVYTVNFSASGTDTGTVTGYLIFGGFGLNPVGPISGTALGDLL